VSNVSKHTLGASYSASALPVIEISALFLIVSIHNLGLYVFEEYFEIYSKNCKMI
jgi:hypothetical protein